MRAATAIVLLLTAVAGPALGAAPKESIFQVTFWYAGVEEVINDPVVPLLPENACYSWYIRLADGIQPTSATEVLTLPEPLADWGTLATDTGDGIDISADSKVATRTFSPSPDAEGWFSHMWCVATGDPTGAHSIEIAIDGVPLTRYDFTVVAPEDYSWPPVAQPQPNERSVERSW